MPYVLEWIESARSENFSHWDLALKMFYQYNLYSFARWMFSHVHIDIVFFTCFEICDFEISMPKAHSFQDVYICLALTGCDLQF